MALTDWRLELLDGVYDFTDVCEWGVHIEETLGQPSTASFTLQDRGAPSSGDFAEHAGGPLTLDAMDVRARILGRDDLTYRGKILYDKVQLDQAFPWRRHDCRATDYQREFYDRRLVGTPTGFIWTGPDSDGNYTPVDPRLWVGNGLFVDGGTDADLVAGIMTDGQVVGSASIDVTTFVQAFLPSGFNADPLPVDRAKVRAILEAAAARVGGNLQYWLDPGLVSSGQWRQHWAVVPRWFEQEAPAFYLALGLPATITPLETAPANIDNDSPDGVSSIGCRDLYWEFDYSNDVQQYWVNGALGFAYNGGVADTAGSGWVSFGTPDATPSGGVAQELLDVPDSVASASKVAAAVRAGNATSQGLLRGRLVVGNERHHLDGWHVGQSFNLKDARLPDYLNDRRYVIQKVTTTLIPGQNWRVYTIEFGDAPIARSSSGRAPSVVNKPAQPGRLWDIDGRVINPPASATITVVGQFERAAPNISVPLELHVWDDTGTPQTGVGSISPTTVITDWLGRWETQLTVGPTEGWHYCVCPVGSNSCVLTV